ncbi:MAG TPA: flagellar motor switch protein FliN [Fimbriimonadaceae bacterium]|nr:flagellar motor switch protein FliN [Fimbriimonadaceae bacterium]
MSSISPDVINKLSAIQSQIWQTVSLTVSEASGQSITFADPLTVAAKTSDLYSEMSAPMLVVQFAFAGLPENAQVLLLPQESFVELATLVKGEETASLDENLVAEVRPTLEGIVQGICLAVGNIKNEPVVASGLSMRYQILSFPPNLQKSDEIVRTQVALTGEDLNGSAIWLMDNPTAHALLGIEVPEEDESPFAQLGTPEGSAKPTSAPFEDSGGLELLMDIPLEISVELGRVKMLVREVVDLGPGSIVEIEKAAGEPVDVMVNGRLVARGEVVVIEDNFGVRITEILNPQERLTRLGEAA